MADTQLVPSPSAGKDETAASRMGIIEINDLVYKLESDLSVAINRTHKNNFFQQTSYDQSQTSTCIFNSGADYIDPRRSFLSLTLNLPPTPVTSVPTDPASITFISAYLGPTGSILNFIDSVVVTTRSGDELSRVNDYGQLMYTYIPWTFGLDWARTIGQEIGLGGYIGGSNTNGNSSANRRHTFQIPLYLLSPFFTYGRLLPSMVMSGLKIEIRWKQLPQAAQQFWEGARLFRNIGSLAATPAVNPSLWFGSREKQYTQDRVYLGATTGVQTYGLDPTIVTTGANATQYSFKNNRDAQVGTLYYFQIEQKAFPNPTSIAHVDWTTSFPNEQGPPGQTFYPARPCWLPGIDQIGLSYVTAGAGSLFPGVATEVIFDVVAVVNAYTLLVSHVGTSSLGVDTPVVLPALDWNAPGNPIAAPGVFRQSKIAFENRPALQFGSPIERGRSALPTTPLATYTIQNPFFQLCSVQLTDSIQRHLNEYSATNGLEIVYADWDRTSLTFSGQSVALYTEVRKSASRALMAFSTIVPQSTSLSYLINSFGSFPGSNWDNYQWQLGSLYFPQQRVEYKGASSGTDSAQDQMFAQSYAFAADAFDRFHPKAAPTIMTQFGDSPQYLTQLSILPIPIPYELRDDNYLVISNNFGQYGSFRNGNQCVAVTLERSSMFDLSGIPINNSRVLALRGLWNFPPPGNTITNLPNNATQFVFLKYVRLGRIFLINAEVEQ
jgi:hypothetical protein